MADLREQLAEAIAAERGTAMVQHFDRAYADAALKIFQPIIDTLTAQNAALMAERDAMDEALRISLWNEARSRGSSQDAAIKEVADKIAAIRALKSDSKEKTDDDNR